MRSKEFYTSEKKLSKKQKSKKEKYVKGMKKSAKDFKARYGDDYKSVMYATATKMAKEDISEKGRIVLEKAGFDPNAIHEYIAVFNDHGDTSKLEDMNRNKIGVADAMAMVLASHDVQNESAVYWSDEDENLDEGVKEYLRKLAAAGIIIGTLAGVGSINDALNNSVDVVKAMNSALEIAQEQGDDEKANEITQDIKGVKLRLDIGKDLNQVKYMQKKYAKFMPNNESAMKEGASLNPYFLTKKEFDGKMQDVWEFPDGMGDEDESPYLSNFSMRDILNSLGMDPNFEDAGPMPIDKFINITTQWLKKHINKPSGEVPTTVDKSGGGATMIGGGKPEGWDNRLIMQFNQFARHIKQKFPKVTHIGIA